MQLPKDVHVVLVLNAVPVRVRVAKVRLVPSFLSGIASSVKRKPNVRGVVIAMERHLNVLNQSHVMTRPSVITVRLELFRLRKGFFFSCTPNQLGTQLCIKGECAGSICLLWNMTECFLTSQIIPHIDKRKLCELACQNGNDTNTCRSTSEFAHLYGLPEGGISLRPGSPCDNFQVSFENYIVA